MSNTITIEFCAEDRARLDRLAVALEAMQSWNNRNCQACVEKVIEVAKTGLKTEAPEEPKDELQERLASTIKEAAEFVGADRTTTSAEPQESPAPTDNTPKAEEKPTDEEKTDTSTAKKVDHAELRAKVIELSAKGLKDQTRDIVKAYAATVKDVPEDKLNECYEKLIALEG